MLMHMDKIPHSYKVGYINNYISEIKQHLEGKSYAEYISDKDIHVTETYTTSVDFGKLKCHIIDLVSDHQIPACWTQLEADLKKCNRNKEVHTKNNSQ